MLMIGLYTVDLLAVVMTTLTSVDTISGEITSGTIHAIATKPLARWQILIGKWLGFVAMSGAYVAIMFWGTIAEGFFIGGVMAQHPVRGALLVFLECIVALSVTFMFGTWFSTLTSGVITLGLLGVAVLGGWLEQNERIHRGVAAGDVVGIISSLADAERGDLAAAPPSRMESPLSGFIAILSRSPIFPFPALR